MNGIFYSLSAKDLLKTSNRDLAGKVSAIWDRCVAPEKEFMRRDDVLLEDVGHWLQQSAYTDETGFFIRFRLHPSYCHQERVQEAGRKVYKEFLELFPNRKNTYIENRKALDGGTETITLVVQTDSHSIGD